MKEIYGCKEHSKRMQLLSIFIKIKSVNGLTHC